jgi:hypothetical protein
MRRAIALALVSWFTAACGGAVAAHGEDGGAPGGNDAGLPSRNPACPTTPPSSGKPCTPPVSCEYVDKPGCSTMAECVSLTVDPTFTWSVTAPDAGCDPSLRQCTADVLSLPEGYPCTASGFTCDFPGGRCGCVDCLTPMGQKGASWTCSRWDLGGTGCPPTSPIVGDACGTPDLECGGGCGISVGNRVRCSGGYWQLMPKDDGPCPTPICRIGPGAP